MNTTATETATKPKQVTFMAQWKNATTGESKTNVFKATAEKLDKARREGKPVKVYSLSSQGVRCIPVNNPTMVLTPVAA